MARNRSGRQPKPRQYGELHSAAMTTVHPRGTRRSLPVVAAFAKLEPEETINHVHEIPCSCRG